MNFRIEAMTDAGAIVSETVDAESQGAVVELLRGRGLMPLKIARHGGRDAAATARSVVTGTQRRGFGGRVSVRDLALLLRQLQMLLSSGSTLINALEAAEQQSAKPAVRALVAQLRTHVEEGGTFSDAIAARPDVFKPVVCSMIAAGEATARLPQAFERVGELVQQQLQVRKAITGALIYPALLSILCVGVVAVMVGFVVPRFEILFDNLNRELPATTTALFFLTEQLRRFWPALAGLAVGSVVFGVCAAHSRTLRDRTAVAALHLPVVGPVLARLQTARILRVWASMLRSNVALLDTIGQSKVAVSNPVFIHMLDELSSSVAGGVGIGEQLSRSPHIAPVVASAIRTGEENGRLPEAVEFVSHWVEDENIQLLSNLARTIEPILLAAMGLAVGFVALSLFLPLFEIATAAG